MTDRAHKFPLPTVDPTLFRDGMSRVPGAVHLVTTDGPEGSGGFTATAVTSVADTPPTLLVCANGANRSCGRLIANGVFCVNTLSHADEALAGIFAGRTGVYGNDRFGLGSWTRIVTGAPALETAVVGFDCRVIEARPVATHLVIFGEVVGVRLGPPGSALVYCQRRFQGV